MKLTLEGAWVQRSPAQGGRTRLDVMAYRKKRDGSEEEVELFFVDLSAAQLACLASSIYRAMKEQQEDLRAAFEDAGWPS